MARKHRFTVDYSDGRFSLRSADSWGAPFELTQKEYERLERHFDEDAYWQQRFREADNEFQRSLEGKTYCQNCKEYVELEADPRGWPFCPKCKGV